MKSKVNYRVYLGTFMLLSIINHCCFADTNSNGGAPASLATAEVIMKIAETFIFNYLAKFLAGLAVLSAAWNLKEQRFGMAVICIFGAIMLATVPTWVNNIFTSLNNDVKMFK